MSDNPQTTQRLLELSTSILRDLVAGTPPRDLAVRLCTTIEDLAPGRIATIMQLDDALRLQVFAAPGAPPALREVFNQIVPRETSGSCSNAVLRGQPALVEDIGGDARWEDLRDVARTWELGACWSFPVWHEGRLVGTFALTGREPGAPSEVERRLLDFGSTIAATLLGFENLLRQRARDDEALLRLGDINTLLAQVNQVIADAADETSLLQQVCDLAIRYGHLALAFVARPDAQGLFHYPASAGRVAYLDGLHVSTDAAIPEGQGSMGRAWRDGRPYFNVSFADESYLAPWRLRGLSLGLTASAVLPIRRGGQVWAVLVVYRDDAVGFDAAFQDLLNTLALDLSRGLDRLSAQQMQRALLDNVLVGIMVMRDRRLVESNHRAAAMLGLTREALIGRPTSDFLSAGAHARIGEVYPALLAMGSAQVKTVEVRRVDGSTFISDLGAVLLPEGGLSVWTMDDVTQRELQAERLHRMAAFNALLAEINHAASEADSNQALFARCCEATLRCVGARRAWIGHDDGTRVRPACDTAGGAPLDDTAAMQAATTALRENRPVFLIDRDNALGDFAALPIDVVGTGTAVLAIHCKSGHALDADIERSLGDVARAVGHGLTLVSHRRRIDALQQLYRALMGEGDVLLQARTEKDMLQRTCADLVRGTLFHRVWIGRPGTSGAARVFAGAESDGAGCCAADAGTGALLARAWTEGTIAQAGNADSSALAAPVMRGGARWAVLVFVSPETEAFDPTAIDLCRRIATLLGHGLDELDLKDRLVAMQNEEAHRARHDDLTGLPNRLGLTQHLEHAIARARRRGHSLAVGMLDLDDFKMINDGHGHAAGDALLRELAQRLRDRLRASDFIARLGGDEFVAVFEDLAADETVAQLRGVLGRMHGAVESPFACVPGLDLHVEMTMGIALLCPESDTPDALLRQADAAMYQAKQRKVDRASWWSVGTDNLALPESDSSFDHHGEEARALLERAQPQFELIAREFTRSFFEEIARQPDPARILESIGERGVATLQARQIEHLNTLMHPATNHDAVVARARAIGVAHGLVGVSAAWMTQAAASYRRELGEVMAGMLIPARERYRLMVAAEARLQCDVQEQIAGIQSVVDAYLHILSRQYPPLGTLWADTVQSEVEALATLPGVLDAIVFRPDSDGGFQVEAMAGPASERIQSATRRPTPTSSAPATPLGQALVGHAWRAQEIQSFPNLSNDPTLAMLASLLGPLGVRSALVIPIIGSDGRPAAALRLLGRFPNQFESSWMRQFANSLQQRWNTVWQRCRTLAPVLPQDTAIALRDALFGGGLRMFVQPVVDLRSGEVVKAEALARVALPSGEIVPPGIFLPLLGAVDLDRLFRLGLDQALGHLVHWDRLGFQTEISLNLPPSTLLDPGCPEWIRHALQRHGVAPRRLTLELLESQQFEQAAQDDAINTLKSLGVRLAMDDLGAGYSSLQRLASLPFDTIKVDQGLARRMRATPMQTLSLIRTIIQIGDDFEREVVVEGIEDDDMLEAARHIGARRIQGYVLARPMPADALVAWARDFSLPESERPIQSALGALAFHWRTMASGRRAGPHALCPLTDYFARTGDPEGTRLHDAVHASGGRPADARALQAWLVGTITRQA